MTKHRPLLMDKLHVILHRGFVEARNLALAQRNQQLVDLADTLELLPLLVTNWEDEKLSDVRAMLENYQSKYKACCYDYLSILDLDDDAFQTLYVQDALSLEPSWIQSG